MATAGDAANVGTRVGETSAEVSADGARRHDRDFHASVTGAESKSATLIPNASHPNLATGRS